MFIDYNTLLKDDYTIRFLSTKIIIFYQTSLIPYKSFTIITVIDKIWKIGKVEEMVSYCV